MNQEATATDWIKFVSVMVVFIVGMVILMINKIKDPWIWIAYVSLWTWVEMKYAKKIHLKWWVWVLILIGLSLLDFTLINIIQ